MKKMYLIIVLLIGISYQSFAIAPIIAWPSYCVGDSDVLHDADLGGVWASLTPDVMTVDPATGKVHAIASGLANIRYTTSAGFATLIVTVNPLPYLISSLTPPAICDSEFFNYVPFSNMPSASFLWYTLSPSSILGVSSHGYGSLHLKLINGSSLPVAVPFFYTISSSCNNYQVVTVTVNPTPKLSSTLTPPDICDSAAFTYIPESYTPDALFSWNRPVVAGVLPTTASGAMGSGVITENLFNTTLSTAPVDYFYRLSYDGCINRYTEAVQVNVLKCSILSETELSTVSRFYRVYPNPGTGIFNIELPNVESVSSVTVSDVLGNIVFNQSFINKPNAPVQVRLNDVPAGVYNFRAITDNKTYTTAVVVKK